MANNNSLFGTLQTPLKPIHYTGIDTETIDVIVNSENRTISANLQPKVTEVIASNVAALRSAYEKLTSLSNEINKVEQVIANIYNELTNNISNLRGDVKNLDLTVVKTINRLTAIEDDYKNTGYNIQGYVDGRIEDKIVQLQEGTLDLSTYAKVEYVEKEVARLDTEISTLLSTESFEAFADETVENFVQLNDSLDMINTRIDTFEASIGPLPSDKTLKEEIFDTFATREALEAVQHTAGTNSVLIRDIDSELFDINKSLEEDYATKDYVAEEISKIDFSDVNLGNYYTKSETLTEIENVINSIDTITATLPEFDSN